MNLRQKINKLILVVFSLAIVLSCIDKNIIIKNIIIKNVYAADANKNNGPESKKEQSSASEDGCPECPDPAKVVLRGLEAKRKKIADESESMNKRKKELERYEEQIDEKLVQLKKLKEQINLDFALLEKKKSEKEIIQEAEFEARLGRLVKTYAGMKPKNAAKIVDRMEIEVARQIFSRMRETSAANILSNVDSEKAAKITEHLAYKTK
ncbi:MAG: hypothetical protein K8R67_11175 [Desulfobacteraceae bacterium]|nr:hypothetical protein [Desulfobacteraceae bacterium]